MTGSPSSSRPNTPCAFSAAKRDVLGVIITRRSSAMGSYIRFLRLSALPTKPSWISPSRSSCWTLLLSKQRSVQQQSGRAAEKAARYSGSRLWAGTVDAPMDNSRIGLPAASERSALQRASMSCACRYTRFPSGVSVRFRLDSRRKSLIPRESSSARTLLLTEDCAR